MEPDKKSNVESDTKSVDIVLVVCVILAVAYIIGGYIFVVFPTIIGSNDEFCNKTCEIHCPENKVCSIMSYDYIWLHECWCHND